MTIGYLIRGDGGVWHALDESNELVGTYGGGLYFACLHFCVRRLMFGSYRGPDGRRLEGWRVEPIHSDEMSGQ